MPKTARKNGSNYRPLPKCPTGLKVFDEITEGGLPKNRISLFSGTTGTGKTLLGIDFLINGVIQYNERGVFMSFEETEDELFKDVASLNLDLQGLAGLVKKIQARRTLSRHDHSQAGPEGEAPLMRRPRRG